MKGTDIKNIITTNSLNEKVIKGLVINTDLETRQGYTVNGAFITINQLHYLVKANSLIVYIDSYISQGTYNDKRQAVQFVELESPYEFKDVKAVDFSGYALTFFAYVALKERLEQDLETTKIQFVE